MIMSFETPPQLDISEKQEKAKREQLKENEKREKELKLAEIKKEVEDIGDALGRGIDENIKEAVVMFKANGLPTSDSCEGHIERGLPVPYIEVSAPNEPERWEGVNDALEKIKPLKESDNEKYHNEYWKIVKEYSQKPETPKYQEWEKENEKLKEKANEFLSEFYKDREVDADNIKLGIEEQVGGFRIHNGGEDYNPVIETEQEFSEEEKKKRAEKVEKYRAEIQEFTKFLENKYFEK